MADELVVELAGRLRREGLEWTAVKLERALMWGKPTVTFDALDREGVFRVLDDPPVGLVALRAAVLMALEDPGGFVLSCAECSCVSERGSGWIAVLVPDVPDDDVDEAGGSQSVAAYCPPCAAYALEYEPRASGYT